MSVHRSVNEVVNLFFLVYVITYMVIYMFDNLIIQNCDIFLLLLSNLLFFQHFFSEP